LPRPLLRAGRVLYFARDYDAAARVFTTVLQRLPESVVARFDLALTLATRGEIAHAHDACDRALAGHEGQALMVAALGNAARAHGRGREYEAARRFLGMLTREAPVSPCCFMLLDTAFGDTERPLEYWDAPDETVGLARYVGLAPVPGSLSMYVDAVGLIAYYGLAPSFQSLEASSQLRALRVRLVS
jgi:tetratricopeptide (TPR) repeat protein